MAITEDLDSLKIQFYAVSGVLTFLVIVLIAVVIDLFVKVNKLRNDEEYEDEEVETRERPPPPPVTSGFSFPTPNISKNWHDDDVEVRRKNDQKEFNLPKPSLSKSWQAYSGDRNQPKRNQGNNFRHSPKKHAYDDDMSNYSYDGNGKNTGGAFRNPLSGNNDNRTDRQSRPPAFKLPSTSGNSFGQDGNDNFGYRRDLQRSNNNYY